MSTDDSLRRQLRFSLFLQIAGAVMFAVATVVRALAVGIDLITIVLALITVAVVAAAVFTRSKMQAFGN